MRPHAVAGADTRLKAEIAGGVDTPAIPAAPAAAPGAAAPD